MKNKSIRWRSFERSDLPKALFGNIRHGAPNWDMESALQFGRGITLGYCEEEISKDYSPPDVIVLDDRVAAETLSWLKAFAPETAPLSQFARVISRSDWRHFIAESFPPPAPREDRWGCVVLGELLSQGDSDLEVTSLPLSWSAACFSTAVARSSIIYGPEIAWHTCIERLLALEKNSNFARRQVTVASLEPVWACAVSRAQKTFDVPEVINFVMSTAAGHTANQQPTFRNIPEKVFVLDAAFMSDSVESRVVAFQRLVAEITEEVGERNPTNLEHAVIAAAAFLVGRGSSHSFLLTRLPRRWANAFAWFGLMVGLAGAQSWDAEWSRAVKAIERSLRTRFDCCGVFSADLSWPEYYWLASTFTGKEVFTQLPKMLPKVLSVEIMPGATCQLRFAADSGGTIREANQSDRGGDEQRERELRELLDQVTKLASRARQLVEVQELQQKTKQESLEFNDHNERESNTSRSRRGKRR